MDIGVIQRPESTGLGLRPWLEILSVPIMELNAPASLARPARVKSCPRVERFQALTQHSSHGQIFNFSRETEPHCSFGKGDKRPTNESLLALFVTEGKGRSLRRRVFQQIRLLFNGAAEASGNAFTSNITGKVFRSTHLQSHAI